jgi:hypothetical protein
MYIKTNLPNGGRTQYFTFQYDSALSQARGVDFATSMMAHCDDDLAQLVSWFSGRSLDTVLPINVSIATVAADATGSPIGDVGASWSGYGLSPLELTVSIGEFPMGSGTLPMLWEISPDLRGERDVHARHGKSRSEPVVRQLG